MDTKERKDKIKKLIKLAKELQVEFADDTAKYNLAVEKIEQLNILLEEIRQIEAIEN